MFEILQDITKQIQNIPGFIAIILGYLIAMAVFVFVVNPLHNYVKYFLAYKFGDFRLYGDGLVSMSFANSFHWIGVFSALVMKMGFALPVNYNRDRLKHPIGNIIVISLSGILVYFLFSLAVLFLYALVKTFNIYDIGAVGTPPVDAPLGAYVYHTIYSTVNFLTKICFCSAVVNIIPLVPMDMGDVLYMFINTRYTDFLRNNHMLISAILFVVLFFTLGKTGSYMSVLCSISNSPILAPILQFYFWIINGVGAIFA